MRRIWVSSLDASRRVAHFAALRHAASPAGCPLIASSSSSVAFRATHDPSRSPAARHFLAATSTAPSAPAKGAPRGGTQLGGGATNAAFGSAVAHARSTAAAAGPMLAPSYLLRAVHRQPPRDAIQVLQANARVCLLSSLTPTALSAPVRRRLGHARILLCHRLQDGAQPAGAPAEAGLRGDVKSRHARRRAALRATAASELSTRCVQTFFRCRWCARSNAPARRSGRPRGGLRLRRATAGARRFPGAARFGRARSAPRGATASTRTLRRVSRRRDVRRARVGDGFEARWGRAPRSCWFTSTSPARCSNRNRTASSCDGAHEEAHVASSGAAARAQPAPPRGRRTHLPAVDGEVEQRAAPRVQLWVPPVAGGGFDRDEARHGAAPQRVRVLEERERRRGGETVLDAGPGAAADGLGRRSARGVGNSTTF